MYCGHQYYLEEDKLTKLKEKVACEYYGLFIIVIVSWFTVSRFPPPHHHHPLGQNAPLPSYYDKYI